LAKIKNIKIFITAPNSDANNELLIETLKKEVNKNKKNTEYQDATSYVLEILSKNKKKYTQKTIF